jgi:thiamine kinase-like enzyme
MKGKIKTYFSKLGHRNITISKVTRAYSNYHTYKVSTNKGKYILKMITDDIQNETKVATREYNFLKIFRDMTPKVIAFDKKTFGHPTILLEFIDGGTIENKPWTDRISREVARTLAKIHSIKISDKIKTLLKTTQPKVPISLNAYDKWLSKLKDKNVAKRLIKIVNKAIKAKPKDFNPAICHGDFKPFNIINSKRGLKIIDWECTDAEDPAIDFAQLFWAADSSNPPSKRQRKIILSEYKKFRPEKNNFEERINWYYSNKDVLETLWSIRYYIYLYGHKLDGLKDTISKLERKWP